MDDGIWMKRRGGEPEWVETAEVGPQMAAGLRKMRQQPPPPDEAEAMETGTEEGENDAV